MKKDSYKLESSVFGYPGMGNWHFVGVDANVSKEIKEKYTPKTRGFGSIRVGVTIGETKWDTSIFPDKKTSTYVLPLKAAVRKKEGIYDGDTVQFTIQIK